MADGEVLEQGNRQGREGNRWVNARPTAEEVAEWFKEAVHLPEGMEHDRYISGVTLIEAEEKEKQNVGFKDGGRIPLYREVKNVVLVPYVKVETRVQYFHDLMAKHQDEWLGVIEPVPVEGGKGLPPGFFKYVADNTPFIGCSMKVTVFKRDTVKWVEKRNPRTGEVERFREGETIIDSPAGTKIVPSKGRYGADPMAVMKAETGAVGRALGMAGMLVVPGSGVATAEDMHEAETIRETPQAAMEEGPEPPEGSRGMAIEEPSRDELVSKAVGLINRLKEVDEPAHTTFMSWVDERGFSGKVSELADPALKGLIRKAEKDLEAAEKTAKKAAKAKPKES